MSSNAEPEPAAQPEDLGRFFLERANAGDVEGLVALYEPGAVLAFPAGRLTAGHDEIRKVYAELLADKPSFSLGRQARARRSGTGTWRSPRRACPAAAPRSRSPAASRTAAGGG